MYIEIEQGIKIPKSNFIFLYDLTGDRSLTELFMAAEDVFWTDYNEFATRIRKAYEGAAVYMDMCYLKEHNLNKGLDGEQLKKEVLNRCNNQNFKMQIGTRRDQPYSFKNCMIRALIGRAADFREFLTLYRLDQTSDPEEDLIRYIRYIYDFGSKTIHLTGGYTENKFVPNSDNCRFVLHSFHQFLCVALKTGHGFKAERIPVEGYHMIPQEILRKLGLYLNEERENLYVKETMGRKKYFLGISENVETSLEDKRESDALRILWDESVEDPANVIRASRMIEFPETDSQLQLYSLPGFPLSMTPKFISSLSEEGRRQIITGIARGVYSLHSCKPAVYYRRLCPEAFYIFEKNGGYKVQLADFRYAKQEQTDSDSSKTVFVNLHDQASDDEDNDYFAPELREEKADRRKINWGKADVFSLGQIWMYLERGIPVLYPVDIFDNVYRTKLSNAEKDILADMLSPEAGDRPDMKEVMRVLNRAGSQL